MPVKNGRESSLSPEEHERKEQILTQHEPAKVPESTRAAVLKHGGLMLLATESGDVPWEVPHGLGLFYQDCRFLDGYTLTINGEAPTVLSNVDALGYETYHELANPRLPRQDGKSPMPKNTVAIRRTRFVSSGSLYEIITLHNFGQEPADLLVEMRFRSEFEDLFVVKGFVGGPLGKVLPTRLVGDTTLELRYEGREGHYRSTSIAFSPKPHHLEPGCARYELTLGWGEEGKIVVSLTPREEQSERAGHSPVRPHLDPQRTKQWLKRFRQIWLSHSATIRSSNPLFNQVIERALLDLQMLRSRLDGLHYFAAGIPWFATLFGRDACTVAIQTMPFGSAMARETLQLLAHYQATQVDEYRDAEPGKILHELRTGELAQTGAIPQSPAYYGTVDATVLFLILMAEYVNWSGDLDTSRQLRPNMEAALEWIDRYSDHDGDGYLDYVGHYSNGLINQGWKDAGNAIPNADGSNVEPPVAVCEVQAYTYRAWRQIAGVLRALGEPDRAAELERKAGEMRARFERDFWSEELGCYVLALQKGGHPAEVVSSNAGQVLWGGIARPDKAERVVERLMRPDMFSGWGIRTLSSKEKAYNPISYHLGSVWPHDNGLIAAGFCRYGHNEAALEVVDALFAAAANFPGYRMPELYCGYERREAGAPWAQQPVRYPVACSPQAWAAGAIPHALWNLLGLRANALEDRLRLIQPRLPSWLDWLELSGVRVGDAYVDLRFERQAPGEPLKVHVDTREGDVEVQHVEELPKPDIYT